MTTDELRAADERVAKELGWHWDDTRKCWTRGGVADAQYSVSVPPYVSGKDWGLLGEMIEALAKQIAPELRGRTPNPVAAAMARVAHRMAHDALDSVPRACLVELVAAGVVKEDCR